VERLRRWITVYSFFGRCEMEDGVSFSDELEKGRCNGSEFAFHPRIGTIVHERCPMWRPGSQRLGLSGKLGAFQVGQGPMGGKMAIDRFSGEPHPFELGGGQGLRRPSADQ
jgi:hypothetical protein